MKILLNVVSNTKNENHEKRPKQERRRGGRGEEHGSHKRITSTTKRTQTTSWINKEFIYIKLFEFKCSPLNSQAWGRGRGRKKEKKAATNQKWKCPKP
jgi:hypothetical protein